MKSATRIVEKEEQIGEFPFVNVFQPHSGNSEHLSELRVQALDLYRSFPFPNTHTPGWRKISLQELQPGGFRLPPAEPLAIKPPQSVDHLKEVVFTQQICSEGGNALFIPDTLPEGMVCGSTSDAGVAIPAAVLEKIGRIVPPGNGKFAAFAHAFSHATSVIYVGAEVNASTPIFFQRNHEGNHIASPATVMIYVARNASATLIQQNRNVNPLDKTFNAGVTEIYLEEGASLDLLDLNMMSDKNWDFQEQKAILEKNATLNWFTLQAGSGFSKSNLQVDLVGRGGQALVTGLFLPTGKQRFYMDTAQNHLEANTASDLMYRGVADGESQSRWEGMIYVDKRARGADGYQANNNLILSNSAKVDAIPGLEIMTDDVRCTHGVTITNIDAEQQFYLTSRGISEKEGRDLIVGGFMQKALDRIRSEHIKRMIFEEFISRINKSVL
ncbi:MAG TPA: Fe-S cluster assembly protein SufD [Anaerolineaceae bacterium]|nr:Fe-S cluster assembly protein SufD [Anaerolineaceae bacterium]